MTPAPAPAPAPRRTGRRTAVLTGVAILAGGAGAWLGLRQHGPSATADNQGTAGHSGAGRQLLAVSLPDVEGKTVALSDFTGRTLVVNFWATWCAPCVEEMPELSAWQQALNASATSRPATQVLGIGIDSAAKIAEFARKQQIAYPLLVAGANGLELVRLFDNAAGGLPFTVIIAPDGRVLERITGRVDMARLRRSYSAN